MAHAQLNMFIAGGLLFGAALAACTPTESAAECTEAKPCSSRGETCDLALLECVPEALSVDATSDKPTPANFAGVAMPFFRGRVCMPTRVQPGDNIPVKISACMHSCIEPGGFNFKKQYTCTGSYCQAATLVTYGAATGTGCPADAFGKFDKSQCVYGDDIKASAGPFVIDGGPVRGNAQVEVPFLSNDDAAEIRDGASIPDIWALINRYPQTAERVFSISMDGANPAAPADCSDESKCDCREIGL